MKSLGKILILIYLITLSLTAREVASVVASVDLSNVERGEMITYEIMLNGDNITRPTILNICGENVISTSSHTSIQMINGTMTKSYILTYRFIAQKSCVINPIEIEIDSRILKTKSIKVIVGKQKVKKDAPFILTLESDKSQVFVGEPFLMTLLFKQRENAEAIDSEFISPNFKGFWIKEEYKSKRYKEGAYTIIEKKYKLAAQRTGELKISSAQMRIAYRTHTRDPWAGVISRIRWKSHYSNELVIGVKAIPNGLSLVGDFAISIEVDKSSIKVNEAVNISIRVLGEGNLEDIKTFKPDIDGVNVFDEDIKIIDGVLMQKMAFVSDRDFEIPSFVLKYYDPKDKILKEIHTKSYSIKVKNAKAKIEELTIKRDESSNTTGIDADVKTNISSSLSSISAVVIFLLGLVAGILISKIKPSSKSPKSKKLDLKDEKKLLIKLLPYKDDVEVQRVLDILESNIYGESKEVLDKKLLKELIMRYKIS